MAYPRDDKDLLARIRPEAPPRHFATFQHAHGNEFIYRDVVFCGCGPVTQPDISAELADFSAVRPGERSVARRPVRGDAKAVVR